MKPIFVLLAVLALQTPALASTMTVTFDGSYLGDDGQSAEIESRGFLYRSSLAYWSGDNLLLHDDGGITASAISRQDGTLFTPRSVDVAAVNLISRTGDTPRPDPEDEAAFDAWTAAGAAPQPVYSFIGYSDAKGGVEASFGPDDLRKSGGRFVFGAAFADISLLWVEISFPDSLPRTEDGSIVHVFDRTDLRTPGQDWCFEYCGELRVDNLTVDVPAAVPLPASALLLGSPLLALAALRRRRHEARPNLDLAGGAGAP